MPYPIDRTPAFLRSAVDALQLCETLLDVRAQRGLPYLPKEMGLNCDPCTKKPHYDSGDDEKLGIQDKLYKYLAANHRRKFIELVRARFFVEAGHADAQRLTPSRGYNLEVHGFAVLTGAPSTSYNLEADGFIILPGPSSLNFDLQNDGSSVEKQVKVTRFAPRPQDQASGFTLAKSSASSLPRFPLRPPTTLVRELSLRLQSPPPSVLSPPLGCHRCDYVQRLLLWCRKQ